MAEKAKRKGLLEVVEALFDQDFITYDEIDGSYYIAVGDFEVGFYVEVDFCVDGRGLDALDAVRSTFEGEEIDELNSPYNPHSTTRWNLPA